uniref:Uncharacterized protein n=1 Tax=Vitrella brassicaformis TaxID=1169539 RepID=A0A7S1JZ23_9ALVE
MTCFDRARLSKIVNAIFVADFTVVAIIITCFDQAACRSESPAPLKLLRQPLPLCLGGGSHHADWSVHRQQQQRLPRQTSRQVTRQWLPCPSTHRETQCWRPEGHA